MQWCWADQGTISRRFPRTRGNISICIPHLETAGHGSADSVIHSIVQNFAAIRIFEYVLISRDYVTAVTDANGVFT